MFETGDIILSTSNGFVSRAIRFFTRGIKEPKTRASHAAIVGRGSEFCYEAMPHGVERNRISDSYLGKTIAVYRPVATRKEIKDAAVSYARELWIAGTDYPYWRLAAWLGDWILGLGIWDVRVFRRSFRSDIMPECSYLVAKAYTPELFRDPQYLSPDDLDDIMSTSPHMFRIVKPWGVLTREELNGNA